MFKKSKKILCFVLAFVLCISSGLSVFAAEEAGTESETTLETENTSESGHKATLNESENGSLQFETSGSSSAYFEPDETATVNVISNKGYQAVHYTVTDASGKELISEDMDGSSFSFKMPDKEVRISATFAAILEEEEIKVSEDKGLIEAGSDIQNAIMNPVTSQYLSEHVDEKYTSAEKIELMNIILVKQTLADKELLTKGETIGSMWESENSTEKFIAMLTTYVAVYDLSDDSDYYAAYVDTMHDDRTSEVIDWCFALNDNNGNVLDNCIYDPENGIAYIPKSEYISDDGEVSVCKIQLQLLQEIGADELESTIQTVTQDEEDDVTATEIVSDMFAEGTTVQTDTGLDEDEMVVSVNGVPVTQDSYEYNSESGQIYMEEVSSAQVQNISVNVEDKNLVDEISSNFKPYEAYALSSWEDTESVRTITLPDWIKAGTVFKGKAPLAYVDDSKAYSYTTYGFSDNSFIEDLSTYIYNGSGSVNVSKVEEISTLLTVEVRPYAVYVDDNNKATTAANSTDTFYSTWSSSSQGTDDEDMDWSQFKTLTLRLQCAHIDNPLMGSLGAKPVGGAYILANCALRFLKVDRTNNYAIFAILTPETHNQQGSGIFRVNLNESGGLYVKKRSYSNTDNIIAGCKYTLYTDADCTTVATTTSGTKAVITTTDESPYSNKLILNDGTYYMKETSTIANYKLNNTIYTVKIVSGVTTTKAVRDYPIDMNLKIVKKSADTSISGDHDGYSLEGAKYTLYIGSVADVYNNDEYTGSMRRAYAWSNAEEVKTYTTDANGEISITRQPCVKNSTMFFIKETTAPTGYELDETIYCFYGHDSKSQLKYNVTKSTDGGATFKTVTSTTSIELNGTVTITSSETPKSANISMTKISGDTSISSDIDNYSLQGAVYTLYEGDITNGSAAGWTDAVNNDRVVGTYTTDSNGKFTINNLPINKNNTTYYLKETKSSAGYGLDDKIYYIHIINSGTGIKYSVYYSEDGSAGSWIAITSATAVESGYTITFTSEEPPKSAKLALTKVSGDTAFTDGNGCYSLEGAVYTLYEGDITDSSASSGTSAKAGWADVISNNKIIGTYTTDSNGKFTINNLPINKKNTAYYLKESKSSSGYGLDEKVYYIHLVNSTNNDVKYSVYYSVDDGSSWTNVTPATIIETGSTIDVTSTEPPLNDPFALRLQKYDADTGETTAPGTASLEGAQFEIKYYDNTNGDTTGDALKTWVFETSSSGFLNISNESYLINEKSDELYKDEDGFIIYPLGTYFLKETQAPKYYQIAGTMNFLNSDDTYDVADGMTFVISTDADGNVQVADGGLSLITADNLALEVYEEIQECSVKVVKYDTDGKTPLADVTFRLVGDDGSSVEGTTDSNGIYEFTGLLPQHYVLTEIATVPGHELLKDNIDITLPLEMTKEEAEESGADVSQAVWDEEAGCYCFYSTTYEVTNSASLNIPVAGGNGMYAVIIAACILIGTGVIVMRKRKV